MLAEGARCSFAGQMVTADIDVEKLRHERARNVTFATAAAAADPHETHELGGSRKLTSLRREYSRTPFVPEEPERLDARVREILEIQSTGLARRVHASRSQVVVVGVSGGLDSTLALVVAVEAMRRLERPPSSVVAVSMPGFGTTEKTRALAKALSSALGVVFREISIKAAVSQHFPARHRPRNPHPARRRVRECAGARADADPLDLGNQMGGLVVGTGDMSELALGFCTYNADHMASYAVNVSVPKTLVGTWFAATRRIGSRGGLAPRGSLARPLPLPPSAGSLRSRTRRRAGCSRRCWKYAARRSSCRSRRTVRRSKTRKPSSGRTSFTTSFCFIT